MAHEARIQQLPGIGVRYDIDIGGGGRRISVVVRHGGTRDLYVFSSGGQEPDAVVELDEETSRRVGAALAGLYFTT